MAKKPCGLGRGLGDLLEDNTPQRTSQNNVVIRNEAKAPATPPITTPTPGLYSSTPKSLYEEKPKNRSIKANFKNFNK